MRRWLWTVLVVGLIGLPTPALPQVQEGDPPNNDPDCRWRDISVQMELDRRRYPAGQNVRMRMSVKNTSGHRCTMVWGDGQKSSFTIRHRDQLVGEDSPCGGSHTMVVEETWRRGHKENYGGHWTQRTEGKKRTCRYEGPRADPGVYVARGHFLGDGDKNSNRVWFRLVR